MERERGDCSSIIGRKGGEQLLKLGEGCYDKNTVIHEFLHALGFHHEHIRSDRDDYVIIAPEFADSGIFILNSTSNWAYFVILRWYLF